MIAANPSRTALAALAGALLLAGCCAPVRADGAPSSAEDQARDLAAHILREAGGDGLGEWTRSVIERAAEARRRFRGRDGPRPLPGERHAPALAVARRGTAEVIVFTSLSVPAASWRQSARDASAVGAPLVLRGRRRSKGCGRR